MTSCKMDSENLKKKQATVDHRCKSVWQICLEIFHSLMQCLTASVWMGVLVVLEWEIRDKSGAKLK